MGRAVVRALLEDGCRVALVDIARRRDAAARVRARREGRRIRLRHQRRRRGRGLPMRASSLRSARSTSWSTTPASCPTTRSRRPASPSGAGCWAPTSTARCSGRRRCVPAMKARRWGRIINTSSLAAKTGGLTAGTAYSVSKGALTSLTFSLARELAAHGVTANAIAPAYVQDADGHRAAERGAARRLAGADPGRPLLRARGVRATSCASWRRRCRASSPARSSISTVAC